MANRPRVLVAALLDGVAVSVGDSPRDLPLRIPSGAYPTPFWLQNQDGFIHRVDALPWQGVMPGTTTISVHSLNPIGELFDRILDNEAIEGDLVVPAGEKWLLGPGVTVRGNILVKDATLCGRTAL